MQGTDRLVAEPDVHPHVPEERAELFTAHDGGSTELEYLELLSALVRCTKPRRILETGSYLGHGTLALARATRDNGFGEVVSIERDAGAVSAVRGLLQRQGLDRVRVVLYHSLAYLEATDELFDFAFLDSCLSLRALELDRLIDRRLLTPGAVVAIHDTSRRRCDGQGTADPDTAVLWTELERVITRHGVVERLELPLSRGLFLLRVGGNR
jgi:predicted O-methyltransferase YrrM